MKPRGALPILSLLSAVLLSLHISQDIVFGFDSAGLNHLVGVSILLVLVCGATLLQERWLGRVVMLLGGVMALGMLPLHMRHGFRPAFLQKDGALLFVWVLYLLGINGALCIVLFFHALIRRAPRDGGASANA
jgi:hypothetical protein